MSNYKRIFLIGLAFALTSCASSTEIDAEAVAGVNDEGLICTKEAKVGSKLGRTVCTTRAEREEAARITREQRRTWSRGGVAEGEITPEN